MEQRVNLKHGKQSVVDLNKSNIDYEKQSFSFHFIGKNWLQKNPGIHVPFLIRCLLVSETAPIASELTCTCLIIPNDIYSGNIIGSRQSSQK